MLSRVAALAGRALSAAASSSAATEQLTLRAAGAAGFAWRNLLQQQGQRGFATNSTDIFNVHKDTPDNNWNTEFDFTQENYKVVQDIINRYPPNYKQSAIIPVLDIAQQQNKGWLSLAAMNRVAKILEMPEIRVYEVATFYTMFNRSKIGKYHIMICGTTPCRLQGAEKIEETLTKHLGIHIGETTPDGLFTLGEMECMGACVNAPMVAIADYTKGVEGFTYDYYEDLTPEDTINVVEAFKRGEKPTPGSQHRTKAEPAGAVQFGKWVPSSGTTTLTGTPRGPYCRDLDKP
uniref:NADH dehydrogenase [ubiquinone] flavoprotein 2, mitochondrial n=1 Tax=Chlamydomonas chlamydogama TaxID=225041 RepID=A0A7S2QTK6_9CHLO|mmetsp:Transcript_1819/g.4061  ORF Transcript_1819/g.4061 Transcript_1819/m.4061 type:complete len:291 (+) Transcript_1819:80-952(+)|eukprot:CAMPEP_0202891294 /NCGR_PEP_ID=MMETSP1392-20130828/1388_1 /ASSEMBLY_ACC=CAM_ASM_000868 /TAXON_ID=225041 /ORGANISM="Chlamydomonas chlamydogama, Strain SAG 11-48b" /LENGTH=290 /DNA_ID=CAMNT_0049574999 /DNA_START=79 /DNA_END=951 /DNA_ORIENTATION=-